MVEFRKCVSNFMISKTLFNNLAVKGSEEHLHQEMGNFNYILDKTMPFVTDKSKSTNGVSASAEFALFN